MNFGPFDVRLDGWDVDYGAQVQGDFTRQAALDESINLAVERPGTGWTPIGPTSVDVSRSLVFIDGVRRLDARLLVRRGDTMCYGAFGSVGVGAVVAEAGQPARYDAVRVGRHLIFGSGEMPDAPVFLHSLAYEPLSTPDPDPRAPLDALQLAMRQLEASLASDIARNDSQVLCTGSTPSPLVICDGPLQELTNAAPGQYEFRRHRAECRRPTDIIGLIKRVFKLYLPHTHQPVLRVLRLGQRTPVFAIASDGPRARYSWFLRLSVPTAVESDLTGLVRLEVAAASGLEAAVRVADETAARLPAFVPSRARDPRSPQNLLPIGALEQHLRHQLGDPRLIRRRLAELIARGP